MPPLPLLYCLLTIPAPSSPTPSPLRSTSLFQAIASVCKTDTVSSAIGSFFMLIFMVTGG